MCATFVTKYGGTKEENIETKDIGSQQIVSNKSVTSNKMNRRDNSEFQSAHKYLVPP